MERLCSRRCMTAKHPPIVPERCIGDFTRIAQQWEVAVAVTELKAPDQCALDFGRLTCQFIALCATADPEEGVGRAVAGQEDQSHPLTLFQDYRVRVGVVVRIVCHPLHRSQRALDDETGGCRRSGGYECRMPQC